MGTNQSLTNALPIKNHQPDAAASDDEFSIWFKAYPSKEQPAKAKTAYLRARQKTGSETLLNGAVKYHEEVSRRQTEPRYVKLPANWLDKESWHDFDPVTIYTGWNEERTITRAEKARMEKEAAERDKLQAWFAAPSIDPYADI